MGFAQAAYPCAKTCRSWLRCVLIVRFGVARLKQIFVDPSFTGCVNHEVHIVNFPIIISDDLSKHDSPSHHAHCGFHVQPLLFHLFNIHCGNLVSLSVASVTGADALFVQHPVALQKLEANGPQRSCVLQ